MKTDAMSRLLVGMARNLRDAKDARFKTTMKNIDHIFAGTEPPLMKGKPVTEIGDATNNIARIRGAISTIFKQRKEFTN